MTRQFKKPDYEAMLQKTIQVGEALPIDVRPCLEIIDAPPEVLHDFDEELRVLVCVQPVLDLGQIVAAPFEGSLVHRVKDSTAAFDNGSKVWLEFPVVTEIFAGSL